MDRSLYEEKELMQKEIGSHSSYLKKNRTGKGIADLSNNKLFENQLPEGINTGDGLPEITAEDEGKVLKVDSGAAVWGDAGSGEEVVAYEGISLLPEGVVFEDWTLHRAIKVGSVLWFVLTGKIRNNSGSSQTAADFFKVVLPSDISANIYRRDGTSVNNAQNTDEIITNIGGTNGSTVDYRYTLLSNNQNEIVICNTGAGITLSANNYADVDVRIPIFLDIGTTQS